MAFVSGFTAQRQAAKPDASALQRGLSTQRSRRASRKGADSSDWRGIGEFADLSRHAPRQ